MLPTTFDRIRLLVMKENFAWVVVSLEYLIVGQGDTAEDAIDNWALTFGAELQLAAEFPDHSIIPARDFDCHLFDASPAYGTRTNVPAIKTLEIRGNTGAGLPPKQRLATLRQGLTNKVVPKERVVFFWHGIMSQWHRSEFTIDGVTYPTAEHYMMTSKARLFGDEDALKTILAANHPREAKDAGRLVRGYRELSWVGVRYHIVFCGNYAKFTQDATLKAALLDTGDRILVEASPTDRIWGIGRAAEDPQVEDPRHWDGLNLLGFTLMDVRAAIRRET